MGDRPALGFTAEDRKVLNQLPVILQNVNEKVESVSQRVIRMEDQKANRSELADLERQIISRLDNFRDWLGNIEKEKADRTELASAEITDHEKRLRNIETKEPAPLLPCADHETRMRKIEALTVALPDALTEVDKLKGWRLWTIGWCAGASLVVVVCAWLIEILVKH